MPMKSLRGKHCGERKGAVAVYRRHRAFLEGCPPDAAQGHAEKAVSMPVGFLAQPWRAQMPPRICRRAPVFAFFCYRIRPNNRPGAACASAWLDAILRETQK
jgi:hypothetical protein